MLLITHWIAERLRICLSIARGQSGNVRNEIVKKHIFGEGFLYTATRGRSRVSDVIWGIKLRGVKKTLADNTKQPISEGQIWPAKLPARARFSMALLTS